MKTTLLSTLLMASTCFFAGITASANPEKNGDGVEFQEKFVEFEYSGDSPEMALRTLAESIEKTFPHNKRKIFIRYASVKEDVLVRFRQTKEFELSQKRVRIGEAVRYICEAAGAGGWHFIVDQEGNIEVRAWHKGDQ